MNQMSVLSSGDRSFLDVGGQGEAREGLGPAWLGWASLGTPMRMRVEGGMGLAMGRSHIPGLAPSGGDFRSFGGTDASWAELPGRSLLATERRSCEVVETKMVDLQ